MIGPKVVSSLTCISCEYLDDIYCTKLERCLDVWLNPPPSCPYIDDAMLTHLKEDTS